MSLQDGLAYWAAEADCAEIDMAETSEFARVWIYSIMYGMMLAMLITIPYRWCKEKDTKIEIIKKDETGSEEYQSEHAQSAADVLNTSTKPDLEAAKRHLVRTSCTKDRKWYNPLWTPASAISELGGTGTELYFRMLRNFGFMYAYMAAFTAPIPIFSMLGNFLPDTGQALAKTTIGNIGSFASASIVDPADRILMIGCQGIELNRMTYYFGWLDFVSILIFFGFVVYFRFFAIPRIAIQDELEQITPKDFAVCIDCLPRTIQDQVDYEKLLSEHLTSRLEYARSRLKDSEKPPHKIEVCEVTLVRDYGGRLGDLTYRAQLQQSKEIAEAHGKNVDKLTNALATLEEKLNAKLKPDEELPVVRAYAILNCKADVFHLLNDYRFADYTLFRLCQFTSRRFQGHRIRVRAAPEPTDILWENQDITFASRVARKLAMFLVFILILVISLIAIYTITISAKAGSSDSLSYLGSEQCDPVDAGTGEQAYKCLVENATAWSMQYAEDEGGDILNCWCATQGYAAVFSNEDRLSACSPWLISLAQSIGTASAASCCVVVINALLQMLLIAMAEFERPLSLTSLNSSMMRKVFFAQTMNTGFILLFVNISGPQVLQDFALVIPGLGNWLFRGPFDDINRNWYVVVGVTLLMNMALNSVVPALVSGAKMMVTSIKRCCLGKGAKHQAELLANYTNPEFDIKGKYAQFLTTVFVTMSYSSGLPLMHLFGCAFMFTMYWMDKFVLLWGSKRPPNYDTQMAKDASEYMLYVIPLHCVFGLFMYGQDCIFPSKPLGGSLGNLAATGASNTPGFLANFAPRVSKESTWMLFALLVLSVAAWVVWTVLWILGGTFGSLWDVVVTTCFPKKSRVLSEEEAEALERGETSTKLGNIDLAASMDWVAASEHIERSFPPASYKLERHPNMESIAHLLRRPDTPKQQPSEPSPFHPPPVSVGHASDSPAQPAVPPANVDVSVAKGFLEAMNAEYVLGTGAAVGTFFENTPGVEDKLISFEEQVRAAPDKNAEIELIAKSWGVPWP